MSKEEAESCSECSFPIAAHNGDVSYLLPSEVAGWDQDRITAEVDRRGSFMKISDKFFIRGLMPVFLKGDYVVVAGVWIEVDWNTLDRASQIWETEEYGGFTCSGYLANELAPWPGTLGANVQLEVRDHNELPYIVSSDSAQMLEVIEGSWPHQLVLESLYPSADGSPMT